MKRNLIKFVTLFATLISLVACSTDSLENYVGVKQLRNPEGLAKTLGSYDYFNNPEALAFAAKMRSFSSKLSESIAKREYKEGENFVVSPLSIELC
ncbi:MAG: hypothetical protein J6X50_04075, partial [Bacilli bacterium]|nr:hypothetical protein [Bacilli bacterium]